MKTVPCRAVIRAELFPTPTLHDFASATAGSTDEILEIPVTGAAWRYYILLDAKDESRDVSLQIALHAVIRDSERKFSHSLASLTLCVSSPGARFLPC